ncbi:MAG TPA: DUF1365 family protein, partial [Rhodobacterales bacterium]|nr:DUF1365 family protein [Rhodobacterales bacterium]
MSAPMWMAGRTGHARRGALEHRFSYGVDYVWLDPEAPGPFPALFGRNRFNLAAIHDRDYGFGDTTGAKWARKAAHEMGFDDAGHAPLRLLTAPRLLGLGFNPVSFWVFMGEGARPVAAIAEVNNTFGDRHAYFCHAPGFAPLT